MTVTILPNRSFIVYILLLVTSYSYAQETMRFNENTNLCDQGSWKLVWSDEFSADQLDTNRWYTFIDDENWVEDRYVANPPVSQASRAGYRVIYRDENVSVGNGACTLTARYQPGEWKEARRNYTSGMLLARNFEGTAPLYFVRGKYEIRARLPKASGVWATFWLHGGGNERETGSEIDMFEYAPCISNLNRVPYHVHGTQRGPAHTDRYHEDGAYELENVDEWHVYTTEWDAHFIRIYVDGTLKGIVSRYDSDCTPETGKSYQSDWKNVFPRVDQGMKLLVTLDFTHDLYSRQILGICLPMPAWLRNRDQFDAKQPEKKLFIDYIRVYQREGSVQDYLQHR